MTSSHAGSSPVATPPPALAATGSPSAYSTASPFGPPRAVAEAGEAVELRRRVAERERHGVAEGGVGRGRQVQAVVVGAEAHGSSVRRGSTSVALESTTSS